jgi:hypothetical protein
MKLLSRSMEIQCRRSWRGVHEFFFQGEYDARASLSMMGRKIHQ